MTSATLDNWGLNKIELKNDEKYLIQFKDTINASNTEVSVEIYNTAGYNGAYSLTDIENIEE